MKYYIYIKLYNFKFTLFGFKSLKNCTTLFPGETLFPDG